MDDFLRSVTGVPADLHTPFWIKVLVVLWVLGYLGRRLDQYGYLGRKGRRRGARRP